MIRILNNGHIYLTIRSRSIFRVMGRHPQLSSLNKQQVQLPYRQSMIRIIRNRWRIFKNLCIDIIGRFRIFRIIERNTTARLITKRLYHHSIMIITHDRIGFLVCIQKLNLVKLLLTIAV